MVKVTKEPNAEQKILEAAQRVFLKKGFAGARMQDIADEAGFNKALVHYYFRNKEKLFEVIFRESFFKLMPRLFQIFQDKDLDIFEKIRRYCETYIKLVNEHPYIPLFVIHEMHSGNGEVFKQIIRGYKQKPFRIIQHSFEEAVKAGRIRPIDPLQLLMNIMSLCLFPTLARPMFQQVMQVSGAKFRRLMEDRSTEVSQFIIDSIKI